MDENLIGHLDSSQIMSSGEKESDFQFYKLSSFLISFMNQLKKSGRSAHTISAYRNDLNLFCEFLLEKKIEPSSYTLPTQDYWIDYLKENGRRSPASLRRAQMSVRSFLHFLVAQGIIERSPMLDIKSPKQPKHQLLTVSGEKFRFLVKSLKQEALVAQDAKAIRDLALILILGECGLKASETANLTWGDIWQQSQEALSSGCLRIVGEHERLIPYCDEVSSALEKLKAVRQELGLSTDLDAKLFFGYLNVSRKTRTSSLHRHGIKFVVYEVCSEILGVPYNSESLRNHAILKWIKKGLDIEKVAMLAGYSSLNSLERFIHNSKIKILNRRKDKKQK